MLYTFTIKPDRWYSVFGENGIHRSGLLYPNTRKTIQDMGSEFHVSDEPIEGGLSVQLLEEGDDVAFYAKNLNFCTEAIYQLLNNIPDPLYYKVL